MKLNQLNLTGWCLIAFGIGCFIVSTSLLLLSWFNPNVEFFFFFINAIGIMVSVPPFFADKELLSKRQNYSEVS